MSFKQLTNNQLKFIQKISLTFMKKSAGSTGAFSIFCRLAKKEGMLKECSNGSKEAYATYLVNDIYEVSKNSQWDKMMASYDLLSNLEKLAMAEKISKATEHLTRGYKKEPVPVPVPVQRYADMKLTELKSLAKKLGAKVADLKGLNKGDLCAYLDILMDRPPDFREKGDLVQWSDLPIRHEIEK